MLRVVLALGLLLASAASALAERRVALVIGNSDYAAVLDLRNPKNDAVDVAAALRRLGFEVTPLSDLSHPEMLDALRKFARKAAGADVSIVYYAGHGIGVDGESRLVPVSARLSSETDINYETVRLSLVLNAVEGAKRLGLVVLDACRDNPFLGKMSPAPGAKRTISRGLAAVEPAADTLVWYAARDGSTADDGEGRNSPFTKALLAHLERPGLELDKLFREIAADVRAATSGRQVPYAYGTRGRDNFYFAASRVTEPEGRVGPACTAADARQLWPDLKSSPDPAELEEFARICEGTAQAALAKSRAARLRAGGAEPAASVTRSGRLGELSLVETKDRVVVSNRFVKGRGGVYTFSFDKSDDKFYIEYAKTGGEFVVAYNVDNGRGADAAKRPIALKPESGSFFGSEKGVATFGPWKFEYDDYQLVISQGSRYRIRMINNSFGWVEVFKGRSAGSTTIYSYDHEKWKTVLQ